MSLWIIDTSEQIENKQFGIPLTEEAYKYHYPKSYSKWKDIINNNKNDYKNIVEIEISEKSYKEYNGLCYDCMCFISDAF